MTSKCRGIFLLEFWAATAQEMAGNESAVGSNGFEHKIITSLSSCREMRLLVVVMPSSICIAWIDNNVILLSAIKLLHFGKAPPIEARARLDMRSPHSTVHGFATVMDGSNWALVESPGFSVIGTTPFYFITKPLARPRCSPRASFSYFHNNLRSQSLRTCAKKFSFVFNFIKFTARVCLPVGYSHYRNLII